MLAWNAIAWLASRRGLRTIDHLLYISEHSLRSRLNEVTGRTVDAQYEKQLLDGILEVSGERAIAMGQAGRKRFEELFCYEKFEERFVGHLLTAASQHNASDDHLALECR